VASDGFGDAATIDGGGGGMSSWPVGVGGGGKDGGKDSVEEGDGGSEGGGNGDDVGEGDGVEGGDCDDSNGRSGGDSAELGRLEAGGWLGIGGVGSRDLRRMAKGIRFAAGRLWAGDGSKVWRTGNGSDTESGWLRVDGGWTAQIDDGDDALQTGGGGGSSTKLGCFGAGGGNRATRSKTGGGTGEGSAGRAGVLAARSVSGVSTSGTGGEGAGGASELWAVDCGSGLCRMSRICCLKLGGKLARTSG